MVYKYLQKKAGEAYPPIKRNVGKLAPLGHPEKRRDGSKRPPIERAAHYAGWGIYLIIPGIMAATTFYRGGRLLIDNLNKKRFKDSNLENLTKDEKEKTQ